MRKKINKILFVCTGNSCRSIMAEAYLKKRFAEKGLTGEVRSAGTFASEGAAPTEETQTTLREENIDASGYYSKPVTKELIEWADMILVMGPSHRAHVLSLAPEADAKIHYLGEFNDEIEEYFIPDPIGGSLNVYKNCFAVIKRSIEGFLTWLEHGN